MQENPSSKKSLIRTIILAVVIPLLVLGGIYAYHVKTSKSQFWFDEMWYQTFTLKNGLEVIVIPNHKIPAVVHMVWYRVGGLEDPPAKSGLAHFLEHLMFKGTKEHPAGTFSKIVEQNGGQENAFTSHDYTAFYQVISKDKLRLMMKLEADRMHNLELKPEQVNPELQVILEERKMRIDNQPRALLKEEMDSALYPGHPYGTQVIGWFKDMETLTQEDALEFYHKYYAPNNAILIVAGDVDAKEVEALADKYYGPIPANNKLKEREELPPPVQKAARQIELADDRVKEPEFWRSYIAPNYGNLKEGDDFYSLILLSKILGEGTLSRLYQSLIYNKKIASMAGSDYSGMTFGPGEFQVYAIPAHGVAIDEVKQAIDSEIEKIIRQGVSQSELDLAKKSLIAEQTYEHEGFRGLGFLVGSLAVINVEPDFVTTFPDRINAITIEQIQQVAQTVFKPENSVTGILKGK